MFWTLNSKIVYETEEISLKHRDLLLPTQQKRLVPKDISYIKLNLDEF